MPGFKHRNTMVTISGSGIDWHDVESYFRPNAVGKYSFAPGNVVVFNKLDRLFDVAIMMDCSQCPVHPQLKGVFKEYAKKNSDDRAQERRTPGVLHVVGLQGRAGDDPAAGRCVYPGRQGKQRAGHSRRPGLRALGRAKARPGALHRRQAASTMAGSYLAACTTYATLFKKSPVGLPYNAGLDPAIARHLQTVAWETVQAYKQP